MRKSKPVDFAARLERATEHHTTPTPRSEQAEVACSVQCKAPFPAQPQASTQRLDFSIQSDTAEQALQRWKTCANVALRMVCPTVLVLWCSIEVFKFINQTVQTQITQNTTALESTLHQALQ